MSEKELRRVRRQDFKWGQYGERMLSQQRRELGLPETPKPLKIGGVSKIDFKKK